jgi:hypothetical protein
MNQSVKLPKDISIITTVDATNLAEALTLVNGLKATTNGLILSYNKLLAEIRITGLGE